MFGARLNNIPNELKTLRQFVSVKNGMKIPYIVNSSLAASVSDESTWCSYQEALNAVKTRHRDGIGFVFTDNDDYVGIDLDNGFDEDGFITPEAAKIIEYFGSYTEKSRSGRGFHVIVKGSLPFKGRNNRQGVEIYEACRYFILTGDTLLYSEIKEVNEDKMQLFLDTYFSYQLIENEKKEYVENKIYQPTWENVSYNLHPTYPAITSGSRNISLLSLAGSLRNQGYSADAMLKELRYVNKHACDKELPIAELKSICRSAMRYMKGTTV